MTENLIEYHTLILFQVLFSWYDWLNSNIGLPLDLIVYLRTSPEVAYKRLQARGRKEEAGVPMKFIEVDLIKFNYDWDWLHKYATFSKILQQFGNQYQLFSTLSLDHVSSSPPITKITIGLVNQGFVYPESSYKSTSPSIMDS